MNSAKDVNVCDTERSVTCGSKTSMKKRYEEAINYIDEHPGETLQSVADRFNIPNCNSMEKYIRYHYPCFLGWRSEWKKNHKQALQEKKRGGI